MNKHILNWLNIILKDRFSNDLILDKLDNKLIIKVKDLRAQLFLINFKKIFYNLIQILAVLNGILEMKGIHQY